MTAGRPRVYDENRVTTSVRFERDVFDRLTVAAAERDLSRNLIINRAVADFLGRLLPVDQIVLTRPSDGEEP